MAQERMPSAEPQPELVVVMREEAQVAVRQEGVTAARADTGGIERTLSDAGATLRPLFGLDEARLRAVAEAPTPTGIPAPDLSVYYRVETDEDLEQVAERLRGEDAVEAAYVKPAAQLAVAADEGDPGQGDEAINEMAPATEDAPPASPDFTSRQGYLNPAPAGVDARFAWTITGGGGTNVNVIDLEGAWRFTHEDLVQRQGGVIGGTQTNDLGWRNHGTAVIGEISGDRNSFGITGICPEAFMRAVSFFGLGTAGALRHAANALRPGDILLIELHRPGPRATGSGQQGFIAIEWWPDDFDAVRFATSRGVVVVAAAGNGAENLDNPIYNTPAAGFPSTWRNPFNRSLRDSGSIIVGAGAPPSGAHGPDRSRLDFSNYGSCVDAQGWGRQVTTTGYGDLQGGPNENLWYTAQFSGTSSASPIVVGALGCLQGIARARGLAPRTPAQARALLRATGSPQQDAPGRPVSQRIGNRPDLRTLIARLLKPPKEKSETKDRKDQKDSKEVRKEVVKDRKDLSKEKVETKEIRDGKQREHPPGPGGGLGGGPGAGPGVGVEGSLEDRVSHLEQSVSQLSHFIGGELRPELGEGALGEEPDLLAGELGDLGEGEVAAKDAKDVQDVGKLSEG